MNLPSREARSSRQPRMPNAKPDPTWLLALTVLLLIVVALTLLGGEMFNYVAGGLGLFVSVVFLGLARGKESQLQATGRFSDWRVSSSKLTLFVFLATWGVGVANVFFIALESTR
jgi:uncharacterized membrane protein YphA (DoxX/SURF4 family)